jgi:hypothetical protein
MPQHSRGSASTKFCRPFLTGQFSDNSNEFLELYLETRLMARVRAAEVSAWLQFPTSERLPIGELLFEPPLGVLTLMGERISKD